MYSPSVSIPTSELVYATLSAEIGMAMQLNAMVESLKEGINVVRELGAAMTATMAIRVTASQCSSKLW